MSNYTAVARGPLAVPCPAPADKHRAHMPGSYILDELAERGWTVQRLTAEMGLPKWRVDYVKRVICGSPLTPEFAGQLSQAFGTSATLWLNLEKAYRKAVAKACGVSA